MDPNITIGSDKYFIVQSKRKIWPIGCSQVPKESYNILSWVFHQTHIPTLIEVQEIGQKLQVLEVGDFVVEWHLFADIKSIICVWIEPTKGTCAKQSCIYYL